MLGVCLKKLELFCVQGSTLLKLLLKPLTTSYLSLLRPAPPRQTEEPFHCSLPGRLGCGVSAPQSLGLGCPWRWTKERPSATSGAAELLFVQVQEHPWSRDLCFCSCIASVIFVATNLDKFGLADEWLHEVQLLQICRMVFIRRLIRPPATRHSFLRVVVTLQRQKLWSRAQLWQLLLRQDFRG